MLALRTCWFPFGSLHFPEAYRCLARPSSALEPSHPLVGLNVSSLNPFRLGSANRQSSVSTRGLNTSLPSCVHPGPIKPVFYRCSQRSLFSGWVSSLDAFSFYPVSRSCSAMPCRTTDPPEATKESSSRTISFLPSDSKHS